MKIQPTHAATCHYEHCGTAGEIKAMTAEWAAQQRGLPKLAYSIHEAADVLGISYISVYRLIKRGLLRPSSALRVKLIAHTELERFLRDTQ
jgi:transposase-like protein